MNLIRLALVEYNKEVKQTNKQTTVNTPSLLCFIHYYLTAKKANIK